MSDKGAAAMVTAIMKVQRDELEQKKKSDSFWFNVKDVDLFLACIAFS